MGGVHCVNPTASTMARIAAVQILTATEPSCRVTAPVVLEIA